MTYLFTRLSEIQESLRDKFILLLLDYDGTLAPIAQTPQDAVISKELKGLLRGLSGTSNCALAIISGRSLEDIKKAVGIKYIIYAGNHGLEMEGPEIKFESRVSLRSRSFMHNVARELRKRLSNINGLLIEDKGLTLSIHYRLVGKKDIPALEKVISDVVNPYTARGKIKINSGKKVYEIRPPVKWDKGKAVLWLIAKQRFVLGKDKIFPIYIGDDVTDEDAFRVLKKKGLTIFVGEPGNNTASYYLKDTNEVVRFLHLILKLKDKNKLCRN